MLSPSSKISRIASSGSKSRGGARTAPSSLPPLGCTICPPEPLPTRGGAAALGAPQPQPPAPRPPPRKLARSSARAMATPAATVAAARAVADCCCCASCSWRWSCACSSSCCCSAGRGRVVGAVARGERCAASSRAACSACAFCGCGAGCGVGWSCARGCGCARGERCAASSRAACSAAAFCCEARGDCRCASGFEEAGAFVGWGCARGEARGERCAARSRALCSASVFCALCRGDGNAGCGDSCDSSTGHRPSSIGWTYACGTSPCCRRSIAQLQHGADGAGELALVARLKVEEDARTKRLAAGGLQVIRGEHAVLALAAAPAPALGSHPLTLHEDQHSALQRQRLLRRIAVVLVKEPCAAGVCREGFVPGRAGRHPVRAERHSRREFGPNLLVRRQIRAWPAR
eukprot:scaffold69591_cov54-Phaeocystis_antarctica.AAC.1